MLKFNQKENSPLGLVHFPPSYMGMNHHNCIYLNFFMAVNLISTILGYNGCLSDTDENKNSIYRKYKPVISVLNRPRAESNFLQAFANIIIKLDKMSIGHRIKYLLDINYY